jgi:hypothetical protein
MRTDGWRGQGNKNGGVERIKEGNTQCRENILEWKNVEERGEE